MKSPYVGTLVPNETITAQFLVLTKDIRQKKTGEPYLSLHLGDRTGEVEAKMWDNVAEVMDTFERDDFVKVKGLVQIYQNKSQLTVHRLRKLEDHEVDFGDYFPCSERDPEEMFAELLGIIADIGNPHLRALLGAFFDDAPLAGLYKLAPAAKSIHHAYRGGLLEHVLSLCKLCRLTAAHYRSIDLDLLITGAILHDIGKIAELTYERSFGYSAEGQLLGHIVIGLRMIGEKIDKVPGFPAKLRTLVEHILISHHGELEFGSPKVPIFPEALLLHHLDNLDSKMEAMRVAIHRDQQVDGEFTGWISALERTVLKKDKYLSDSGPAPKREGPVRPAVAETKPDAGLAPVLPATAIPATVVPGAPVPAAAVPAAVEPRSAAPALPRDHKPAPPKTAPTLFGEKLQAVLGDRK
jgi:3'-5' exoribonuclease